MSLIGCQPRPDSTSDAAIQQNGDTCTWLAFSPTDEVGVAVSDVATVMVFDPGPSGCGIEEYDAEWLFRTILAKGLIRPTRERFSYVFGLQVDAIARVMREIDESVRVVALDPTEDFDMGWKFDSVDVRLRDDKFSRSRGIVASVHSYCRCTDGVSDIEYDAYYAPGPTWSLLRGTIHVMGRGSGRD